MATRTFKLVGHVSDGDTGANITVNFNSVQVFTGSVTNTTKGDALCTFTADTTVSGDIATSVVVNSGSTVYVGPLQANYVVFVHDAFYDEDDGTTVTAEAVTSSDVTSTYDYMNTAQGNSMKSVQIDGADSDIAGTASSGWVPVPVESGSTLTCNMVVDAIATAPA